MRWMVVGLVVALASACGGEDEKALDVPTSPSLSVRGGDMFFDPDEIAVNAGQVEVRLENIGAVLHDIRIEDVAFVLEAAPGETATGTVVLQPGRYDIFCSLPGHREAGMEGVVEVR